MTDTVNPGTHVPFGVGTVVSDTFSIFFKKIHIVILLGFIPALIDVILNTYSLDTSFETVPGSSFDWGGFAVTIIAVGLISLVAAAVTTAMVIQLAYDTKLARSARIGQYFSAALSNLPAIAILSIVTAFIILGGTLFIIIPGLWLYAVFSVVVPAIVIEGAGFGALRRSASLTKDYRWPIAGTLVLVFLCVMLVSFVLGFLLALVGGNPVQGALSPTPGPWLFFEAALNAIAYGWTSVAIALIFARLKEIKEGVSVSDLADVFK
ncbi:hypothetical protein [uncultured Ruegeria sp.]|uniref:hypothetical protein n=1 Tax=uncultured Ruegeria sp. TaxID=259304 RepID=UPI00260E6219|nr:hypothetical protein [uncultured Ruegeria sp.]